MSETLLGNWVQWRWPQLWETEGSNGAFDPNKNTAAMSFAIVRVEVQGSSCVRVELGSSSKISRVSISRQFREFFFCNFSTMSWNWLRHVGQIVASQKWPNQTGINVLRETTSTEPLQDQLDGWFERKTFPRHCRGIDTRENSELNSNASVFSRLEPFPRTRQSTLLRGDKGKR